MLLLLLCSELGSLEVEHEHYKSESVRLANQLHNERVLKQQVTLYAYFHTSKRG